MTELNLKQMIQIAISLVISYDKCKWAYNPLV